MSELCISEVARLKILILKHGVRFEPTDMFNHFPDISNYKVKWRIMTPTVKNFRVFDKSTDISIIPSEILLTNNKEQSIVKLRYDENSPLVMRINEGKIEISYNGKPVEPIIELVEYPLILKEKLPPEITQKQSSIGDYVDIVGIDRVSVLFFDGCYNWLVGKPCKFCDLHPKKSTNKSFRPSLNNLVDYELNVKKWWDSEKNEFLKALTYSINRVIEDSNHTHLHLFFMAGNLPTNLDVWDIAEETLCYLGKYLDIHKFDNYLNIAPHDTIQRLWNVKSLGIHQVQYNLEVTDPENFAFTCPGKIPFRDFEKKLSEATTIMGKGKVRSNFVLGLDDFDCTLRYARMLAERGIVFDYSVFQPKKCTPFCDKPAPDFDAVIGFSFDLAKLYKEYSFSPIFCSLSSRSSILNELVDCNNG